MLSKRFIKELDKVVGRGDLLTSKADLILYEYDASFEKGRPEAVVFVESVEEVSRVVKLCNRYKVPFVARGAGTNLSGGSLPVKGGIVIALSRMNRILEICPDDMRAVVEPGVVNLDLNDALTPLGCYYAPDPASQKASTLGGNVAENSGGPHCLKYGVTTNHVLGLEVVLPDGEVVNFGGKAIDAPGYDIVGLFVGSEGTIGIATKIIVRIMKKPEHCKTMLAIYGSIDDAARSVSEIIALGIIPAALEMMDRPVIEAVEASVKAGYPADAEAVLIIELDGIREGMERLTSRIEGICFKNKVREVRAARDDQEREALWAGRRGAFGAVARLRPNYFVVDGTVPRTRLPEALKTVCDIGKKYNLLIANVFHAGDGNLHPLILFDERNPGEKELVLKAAAEISRLCVQAGGTITGEHGVGLEKIDHMRYLFSEDEIDVMREIRGVFDPEKLCNPEKLLPEKMPGV